MDNGIDRYIGRCLKNWTAKYQPPLNGRARLIHQAGLAPALPVSHPFAKQITDFLNRYSSVNDQFYYPRQWQITGPFTQSLIFSLHIQNNTRLAT